MYKKIPRKWWALVGVSLAGLMVGTDFTIVNTVLPDIEHEFSMQMRTLQWVMTGFGITFAALLVSAGRLGDLLGRRFVLYIGIIGFALASLGAALSVTAWQLIVARLFQGVFASATFPCGTAIVAEAFKTDRQARALSIYGSFLGIGMAAGPMLGGLITSVSNWRWIFLINLPITCITLVIFFFAVEESRVAYRMRIDWIGMILLSVSLSALIFAVTESQVYGWTSPPILAAFTLCACSLIAFLLFERKIAEPLLPLALFSNRPFFVCAMLYIIGIAFIWSVMFFVPLYLQRILHLSTGEIGVLLVPMTGMTILAPPLASYLLHKKGPQVATLSAFASSIIGLICFLYISTSFSLVLILIAFMGVGLSWGIANGVATPIALSHPGAQQHAGLVSGAASTILNIVGIVTLAIASTLFYFVEEKQRALALQPDLAFMSGFHAVMAMLLVFTCLSLLIVLYTFWQGRNTPLSAAVL